MQAQLGERGALRARRARRARPSGSGRRDRRQEGSRAKRVGKVVRRSWVLVSGVGRGGGGRRFGADALEQYGGALADAFDRWSCSSASAPERRPPPPRPTPETSTHERRTTFSTLFARGIPPAGDPGGPSPMGAPRRARRAQGALPSPSWACAPTCCAPSTRWASREPMPVQATTFPLIDAGRDLMVQSRTGSGKTAAFGIPFANGIVKPDDKFVQAIVLLPTRELALQVAAELAQDLRLHAGSPWCRSTAARRWAGRSSSSTPAARSSAARPGACSITCARHAAARQGALRRARRVRRDAVDGLPGGHRGHPRADAGRAADAAVLGDRARGDPAPRRAGTCATPSS